MKRKHPLISGHELGTRHICSARPTVLRLSFFTVLLMVCWAGLAPAQNFVINMPIRDGDRRFANTRLLYESNGMENEGPKRLRVTGRVEPDERENDEDGAIRMVRFGEVVFRVVPPEPAWASTDPNAFTIHRETSEEGLVRCFTFGLIEDEEGPVFRQESIHHGETMETSRGHIIEHGSTVRIEMRDPVPGMRTTSTGHMTESGFEPHTRSTVIRYRDNPMQRLVREIEEKRSDAESDWETLSDNLHAERRIDGRWRSVLKIEDPDGEALTEEWEYYEPGDVAGPDGSTTEIAQVKRHRMPDGSEVFSQYTPNRGSIVETRRPGAPVRRITRYDTEGVRYHGEVTRDGRADSTTSGVTDYDRIEITEEDGVEIRRRITHFGRDLETTTTRMPGQEDRVSTQEIRFYSHAEPGDHVREVFEDGTMRTLTVDLDDDGRIRRVVESGRHENEVIVEGERAITILPADSDSGPAETITETIPAD